MFKWTISSKENKWALFISTLDVNKIILKIRAGLGSIEELTLVRPFHSRWSRHLQLQVLKDALVFCDDIIDQFNVIIEQAGSILLLFAWLRLWHYSTADPGFSRLIKPFCLLVWDQNRWIICEFEILLMWERIIQLYSPIDRHFQCSSVNRIFS